MVRLQVLDQLTLSAIGVLDLMRFGSARFLRIRLMRIHCELYNKRNCAVAVLHKGTFQDHVQRDFLVVSQDVERSTIPFFTMDSKENKEPAAKQDGIN